MRSYQAEAPNSVQQKSAMTSPLAIGGAAFVVGAALTLGYVKWSEQQQQIAQMTLLVEQLGQQRAADQQSARAEPADNVTRDAPLDLLTIAVATPQPMAEPAAPVETVETPAVATPAAVAAVATPTVEAPAAAPTAYRLPDATPQAEASTADKLRDLVSKAAEAPANRTLDDKAIQDARRLETLAIVHAGVQELVAAVVAGEYDIHTDYKDEDFSGRIHFAFVGHEENQKELESFLANAAETGVVAHSSSVVDGNGKVNGHILLFDLVERALENGTYAEQRAGQKMRREAVAMLAKDSTVGQVADSSGQRFYTVEPGDSLAYIALQFYGNTNAYVRIFEANRSALRTPDRIRVGQRLLIPSA